MVLLLPPPPAEALVFLFVALTAFKKRHLKQQLGFFQKRCIAD